MKIISPSYLSWLILLLTLKHCWVCLITFIFWVSLVPCNTKLSQATLLTHFTVKQVYLENNYGKKSPKPKTGFATRGIQCNNARPHFRWSWHGMIVCYICRTTEMSRANASQICDPVSSSAQAEAIAAEVSEGKLIYLDTSSQARSYLPLILPLKLGRTWGFTHLLSRSSTQAHKQAQTHGHVFAHRLSCYCVFRGSQAHTDREVAAYVMNKIQGVRLDPYNQSGVYTWRHATAWLCMHDVLTHTL